MKLRLILIDDEDDSLFLMRNISGEVAHLVAQAVVDTFEYAVEENPDDVRLREALTVGRNLSNFQSRTNWYVNQPKCLHCNTPLMDFKRSYCPWHEPEELRGNAIPAATIAE